MAVTMKLKALRPIYAGIIVTGQIWDVERRAALRLISSGVAEEVKVEAPKKRGRPRKEQAACE